MSWLSSCYVPYFVALGTLLLPISVQAQSITPADSATSIQQTGTQYQIDGGNLSGDSTTLFHSFDQFGLLTGESAQFNNPATVKAIVGRIIGGDVSIMDGLLAANGNANLYLLNPAGLFFGENTQLNLGGSFSASTATGLNFGSELLDTLGSNDYGLLTGAPTGYVFSTETGALINAGDLAVTSGQSLSLLGGQVMNTGQLAAPGGDVLVMAVPGENRVRLSQSGSILGLELETLPNAVPTSAFTAATVPALLTGASDLGMATNITINPDGTVSLSGSSLQIPVDPGTAVVNGQLEADGGNIGIFGEQLALVEATVDASGDAGGGTVLIGGDELGNGTVPNALATIIDENSVIQANARDTGNGGKIVAWGTNLLRSAGQLFARGGTNGGDGGFIETSSLGVLEVGTAPDLSAVGGAGGLWLLDPANIRIVAGNEPINIITTPGDPTLFDAGAAPPDSLLGVELIKNTLAGGADVEIRTAGDTPGDGNITLETPLDYHQTGDSSLSLIADGEIQLLADIFDSASTVTNPDPVTGPTAPVLDSFDNLDLTLEAIDQVNVTGSINSGNGDIDIISFKGDINIGNTIDTVGGDVIFEAPQGAITVSNQINTGNLRVSILTSIPFGGVGAVLLDAQGAITADDISARAGDFTLSSGAPITIESQTSIQVGDISTSGDSLGSGPSVTLATPGDIVFDSIATSDSVVSTGGDVVITSAAGNVRGTGTGTTIETDGLSSDGSITITHGGGLTDTPFRVGDSSVNGTAGSISTGTTTIENESFAGSVTRGNIEIITTGTEPGPEPEPEPEPEPAELEEIETLAMRCLPDCEDEETANSDGQILTGAVNVLPAPELALQNFERQLTKDVTNHLGLEDSASVQITDSEFGELSTVQQRLRRVQGQIGKRPAVVYAVFGNAAEENGNVLKRNAPSAPLELLLVTGNSDPKYIRLAATREEVLALTRRFQRQVTSPNRVGSQTYLPLAQKLYQILIAPLEEELEAQGIDTISFITDVGLRSLPIAALHNGEKFLIENYNVGIMPSLSLTDLTYRDISDMSALVAGTSVFADQSPLPGVPVELEAISSQWSSSLLQGDTFNLNKLQNERQQSPYGIIHLATHGEFNAGDLSKSYLHLHTEKLRLDQLRSIGLHKPAVELITLSACQTALGSRTAELGFAGFAVLAGAKTAVASLWSVSDEASAGLMIEFYQQLQNPSTIKAEALRRAQLAMLYGEISVEGDRLKLLTSNHQLPSELSLEDNNTQDFSHPYYWAAFTMIGSPW